MAKWWNLEKSKCPVCSSDLSFSQDTFFFTCKKCHFKISSSRLEAIISQRTKAKLDNEKKVVAKDEELIEFDYLD